MQDCDTFEILEDRLNHLGDSLNKLFSQLVDQIDQVHLQKAANYLKYVMSGYERENDHENSVLHVAFGFKGDLGSKLEDFLDTQEYDPRDLEVCQEKLDDLTAVLATQTAGLLDVDQKWQNIYENDADLLLRAFDFEQANPFDVLPSSLDRLCLYYHELKPIRFIHRSAIEFLRDSKKGCPLIQNASMTDDEILKVSLKAHKGVANAKFHQGRHLKDVDHAPFSLAPILIQLPLDRELRNVLTLLSKLDSKSNGYPRFNSTDDWLKAQCSRLPKDLGIIRPGQHFSRACGSDFSNAQCLVYCALELELYDWPVWKAHNEGACRSAYVDTLLHTLKFPGREVGLLCKAIFDLLGIDGNPNQVYSKTMRRRHPPISQQTLWGLCLSGVVCNLGLRKPEERTTAKKSLLSLMAAFLARGADPNAHAEIVIEISRYRSGSGLELEWIIRCQVSTLWLLKNGFSEFSSTRLLETELASTNAQATANVREVCRSGPGKDRRSLRLLPHEQIELILLASCLGQTSSVEESIENMHSARCEVFRNRGLELPNSPAYDESQYSWRAMHIKDTWEQVDKQLLELLPSLHR